MNGERKKQKERLVPLFLIICALFLEGCVEISINKDNDNNEISARIKDADPIAIQNTDNGRNVPKVSELYFFEDSEDETILDTVEEITLDPNWLYADYSTINSGTAMLYRASNNRCGIVVGINAGHGTKGGESQKTYCHPNKTPKVTGGSTSAGSIKAPAVSGGMRFSDGTFEAEITLKTAILLREKLLDEGYDVLMLRDDQDVQLDNIARTVIANNNANCLISLHWDGDGLEYDKGCFYISTPDGIKDMEPVSQHWEEHHNLGEALITGLKEKGCKIYNRGSMPIDLTQTSYSCIPSIDIELGNQSSAHDEATLATLADGMAIGINRFFE